MNNALTSTTPLRPFRVFLSRIDHHRIEHVTLTTDGWGDKRAQENIQSGDVVTADEVLSWFSDRLPHPSNQEIKLLVRALNIMRVTVHPEENFKYLGMAAIKKSLQRATSGVESIIKYNQSILSVQGKGGILQKIIDRDEMVMNEMINAIERVEKIIGNPAKPKTAYWHRDAYFLASILALASRRTGVEVAYSIGESEGPGAKFLQKALEKIKIRKSGAAIREAMKDSKARLAARVVEIATQ